MVEEVLDLVEARLGESAEGRLLGKEATDQGVAVLVGAALAGAVGGGEIDRDFRGLGEPLVVTELGAVVQGEGLGVPDLAEGPLEPRMRLVLSLRRTMSLDLRSTTERM